MAIGIEPTVDYAFKRLFGSPDHTSITIHFLNAVLTDAAPIQEVELLNPMIPTQSTDDKLPIPDVRARDNHGRWLNIEMQTSLPAMLAERLTLYNALNYTRQLRAGDRYLDLCPAISICVLNRILFREGVQSRFAVVKRWFTLCFERLSSGIQV